MKARERKKSINQLNESDTVFLLFKKKDNELIERLRKEVDGAGNEEVQRRCDDDDGEGGGEGEEQGEKGCSLIINGFLLRSPKNKE